MRADWLRLCAMMLAQYYANDGTSITHRAGASGQQRPAFDSPPLRPSPNERSALLTIRLRHLFEDEQVVQPDFEGFRLDESKSVGREQ